jgi:SH3-like domain-containing protein
MAVVVAPWAASHPAMTLRLGDLVDVGDRDDDWPEYVWCTRDDGEGWVPDEVLSLRGDGSAVALRDYSTAELSVEPGDEVTVIDRLASWSWCEDAAGRRGWVPDSVLGD